MFELFDFEILQARYVKAAMEEIATFRPDGKVPADVQAMIDAALAVRTTFQIASATRDLANGELKEARDAAHLACIQVYPIMKSRYRTDPGSLSAINRLPVDDQSMGQTIARGEAISILWGQLPNPPGSATPFKAWDTMDKAAFDAILATLKTKAAGVGTVNQDYEIAQGNLHEELEKVEDFVTAALITGRAQFPIGTPEREVIDAIPMEPSQQPPAQAVISVATSPAAATVHLEYDADRATSWDVLHKPPGAPDFAVVADDVIVKVYNASGLAAGSHDFLVIGHNSQGPGPASAVATVAVS